MMLTLSKALEPLKAEDYRVREPPPTPSKVIMPPKCQEPPEVKDKGKALEGSINPILNRKQGIILDACLKDLHFAIRTKLSKSEGHWSAHKEYFWKPFFLIIIH